MADLSSAVRNALYPEIEPYAGGMLDLDGLHKMYWEQCGNPQGEPILFLHGGPGAGAAPAHRRFFDPAHYRIVIYDQRGAGRSTPLGELKDNTTPQLVADIEALRRHLGIERWLIFGGSWGSTLALAYGEAHPERCCGFILRGIFLCRRSEIDWFLYGLRTLFPEAWHTFAGMIPRDERGDLLAAYYRQLTDPDPRIHMPAARAWSTYEGACSTLLPSPETVAYFASDGVALGLARIEAHYFSHDIFLPDDYPPAWAWRRYNEQAAVASLIESNLFKVDFASHALVSRSPEHICGVLARLPLVDGAIESSLWLTKN